MLGVQLRLVAGPQSGASMTLSPGAEVRIGGEHEHDVLLRDSTLDGRALSLRVEDDTVVVHEVSGSVIVGDATLIPGQSVRLAGDVVIKLGDTHLHLSRLSATVAASIDEVLPAQDAPVYSQASLADGPDTDGVEHLSAASPVATSAIEAGGFCEKSPAYPSRFLLKGALCTFGLLLMGLALGGGDTFRFTSARAVQGQTLSEALQAEGFDTLNVDRQTTPAVVLGFLATRDESMRLDGLLRRQPGRARNRVQVGEELATRVEDVFRLNGVEAVVTVVAAGEAQVSTGEADEVMLQRVVEQARRDLPRLTRLELENTVPNVVAVAPPPGPRIPGKRVSMVISAAPAHVVTEDRSRYFVGSLLPSGHRIMAIDAGTVSLFKSGQRTELVF